MQRLILAALLLGAATPVAAQTGPSGPYIQFSGRIADRAGSSERVSIRTALRCPLFQVTDSGCRPLGGPPDAECRLSGLALSEDDDASASAGPVVRPTGH